VGLGYPDAPDLAVVSGRLSMDLDEATRVWVGGSYAARGEGSLDRPLQVGAPVPGQTPPSEFAGTVQKTLGVDAGARVLVRDNLRLEAELGWRHARNWLHVEGATLDQAVGRLLVELRI
jgi:hypothetical protein